MVDAANVGNLARFVNHSCDPNLFAQPVLSNHHDVRQSRICFFAAKTITLYEELTYGPPGLAPCQHCEAWAGLSCYAQGIHDRALTLPANKG